MFVGLERKCEQSKVRRPSSIGKLCKVQRPAKILAWQLVLLVLVAWDDTSMPLW